MRRLLAFLLLLSACVGNASGQPVAELLAGRTVIYGEPGQSRADAMWQAWDADGSTRTGGPSIFHSKSGKWKMEKETYCEIFGISEEWTCWRITLTDEGKSIRFWEIPGDLADLAIFHKDIKGFFEP